MSFFSIAATIKRLHNDLIQGMQQHPQVTSMDTNTAIETRIDSMRVFHLPNSVQPLSLLIAPTLVRYSCGL